MLLEVQMENLRFFSLKVEVLFGKYTYLHIYSSKYYPSLSTNISRISNSIRISRRKNCSVFEAIYKSTSFLSLSKYASVAQPGYRPLIVTSGRGYGRRIRGVWTGIAN